MTAKLLTQYKQQIEQLTLIPSKGGCFELKVDGELIYSKLETGQFPDESALVKKVGSRHREGAGAH